MADPTIPTKEYVSRRNKVLRSLKGAVGLVMAGKRTAHLTDDWRPNSHFEYLTGIVDEPGAAVVFDPSHPRKDRRVILVLAPRDPDMEKWDGFRADIDADLKGRTGFETIVRTGHLPGLLRAAGVRAKRLGCLHPLAAHTGPVSPDLEIFGKLSQRIPGCRIEDHSDLIPILRTAKSTAEVRMIKKAVDITAAGYAEVLETLRPGMNEFEVQETLEHAYKTRGARGTYYGTIVGGAVNSTVLHYRANDRELADGDLVCVDSAGAYRGYTADITRTFPVNGKFTKRQRKIYDIVLKAELAAIKATKPGATLFDIDKAARDIIEDAGFGDYYPHSIGHHLGIEVHDSTPVTEMKLPVGAVITIEPGIYLPDEAIGVRIEDDIQITKTGSRNLSAGIPKDADVIESIMAKAKRRRR